MILFLTYLSDLPSQWAGTSGLDGIATHGVSDEDTPKHGEAAKLFT